MAWLRTPSIGLALGGGAARGLAHLGVLEVLEEAGLRPACVAGTSIGALIGGIWATTGTAEAAIDKTQAFVTSPDYRKAELEYLSKAKLGQPSGWAAMIARAMRQGVFYSRTFLNQSFVSQESYRHNIEHLLPDVAIEDLRVPFAAVAADLLSGESIVFRRGSLRQAVSASGAVPGVMPPQVWDGRLLSDGALVDKIPARALLSMPVDVIVGVDVSTELASAPNMKRGLEIITRANQVTEWNLRHARKVLCDVMVRPRVQHVNWLNFITARPAIGLGRDAMESALPELRRRIREARVRALIGRSRIQLARRMYRRGWFGQPPIEV
ncbi:MAG: patatin-like phospholipase family protein [Acidobacteriota bacterium]|nr:MAG: patatin-like phospholipase family protein [Acidobacteriota bacterium]